MTREALLKAREQLGITPVGLFHKGIEKSRGRKTGGLKNGRTPFMSLVRGQLRLLPPVCPP